jgi:hypothetical protein
VAELLVVPEDEEEEIKVLPLLLLLPPLVIGVVVELEEEVMEVGVRLRVLTEEGEEVVHSLVVEGTEIVGLLLLLVIGEVGDILINEEELQYSSYEVIVIKDGEVQNSLTDVMVAVTVIVTAGGP